MKHIPRWAAATAIVCSISSHAYAATTSAASANAAFALVKVLLALGLVLAAIVAIAWLLRRMSPIQQGNRYMRVIGSAAIGQRERLVLVEIGDTWFVLGVAPGHISIVHTLPKQAAITVDAVGKTPPEWLARFVRERKL